MTKIFISSHYVLLTYIIYNSIQDLLSKSYFNNSDFIWFAKFFSNMELSLWSIFVLCLSTLAMSIYCLFNSNRWVRILSSVLFITMLSFLFSFGKIPHSKHAWIFSSIFMCFIDVKLSLNSSFNKLIIRLMQTTLLTHYLSSGIWKLRKLEHLNFDYLQIAALDNISYGIAEGNSVPLVVIDIMTKAPYLITIGFICVLLFQLSCFLPIILRKYYAVYGVFAICFHFTTGLSLGIYFSFTVLSCLFLLVFTEFLLQSEKDLALN